VNGDRRNNTMTRSGGPEAVPPAGRVCAEMSPARTTWKFSVIFLLLVSLFSWVASSPTSGIIIHDSLSRILATLSVKVLALFGYAAASGHDLAFNGFRASIEGACDGVQPTYIYIAAVLAFPSRWSDKGWGILIGIPVIFLINFARIATMMVCGAYSLELFERLHLYGWQALVIVLTLALWVFWTELFVRRHDPSAA
jgi:exosortase/archaeosortase family protein